MTTHILIELVHPPFEVTRESIESLPDWVGEGQINVGLQHWHYWWGEDNYISSPFGHYLISYRGKIEVWPPEDVAKYLKQNPYEACAKVVKDMISPGSVNRSAAIRSIRQLEQKEIGK